MQCASLINFKKNKIIFLPLILIISLIILYALTTLNKEKNRLLQVDGYLFSCTNQTSLDNEIKSFIGEIKENLNNISTQPEKNFQSNFLEVGTKLYWWNDENISDSDMEGVTVLINKEYKVCRPYINNPSDFFDN
ncbi:MAG: hypothetical protein ACRDCN_14695 [Tannerellaceae bacterium]|uniref:hypothetical protein n=1 Tax=Serratia sp. (in: enterobacteria) TaxID=616 RepID=UPI003EE7FC47